MTTRYAPAAVGAKACALTRLHSKQVREDTARGATPPGWYRGSPDLTEFARLSAEARELRERIAAMPGSSQVLQRLKALPQNTPLQIIGSNHAAPLFGGRVVLNRIDESANAIHVIMFGSRRNEAQVYPLDKVDTVFPSADWQGFCVAFYPYG